MNDGRVERMGEAVTLPTADHASLQTAWTAFGERLGRALPRAAGIAVASPIGGDIIKLTNNPWIIRPALIGERLDIERFVLVNDFGAVAHAVARLPASDFVHLCGPDEPLPAHGVTTVCGPGTGLGVAQVVRRDDGYQVIETEGGHVDYAPLDSIEDAIVARLRPLFTRVSTERVCSGPAIVAIYETIAALEGLPVTSRGDRAIWTGALSGTDPLALAALDRFCLALGAVTGDLALAHGADGVVVAGGLGLRLRHHLLRSGFGERFVAKGRFRPAMARIPVRILTHPQPGLFGAAAAFAQRHS
ncbi:MAG: glucokinase [Sphingomonas bacterium]|nr:glucokinase [Sphingomonas bacterium]